MKYSLILLILIISLFTSAVEAKDSKHKNFMIKKAPHVHNVKKIPNKKVLKPKNNLHIGLASFYGKKFHGKKTASGEIFNQNGLTAAHRFYPLQSKVKVTNLKNNKSIIVRINDRGPWVNNRIMDLSKGAAVALNISGVEKVSLNLLN